jgi:hypothetical protein
MKKVWTKIIVTAALCAVVTAQASALAMQDVKIDKAVNSPTITIRYSKVKPTLIELRLNGKSIATRNISSTEDSGETNFTIDLTTLTAGDNKIEAVLFDKDGKVLATQTSTMVAELESQSAVTLQGPRSGDTVKGAVEIKLGVNREFKEMYVSFFIDDAWKSLKNYPPFNFIWDTTRFSNGWHEIQAWVVDENNDTYKTRKIRVYVNNPGGRTDRVNPATVVTTAKPTTIKPVATPKPVPVGVVGPAIVAKAPSIPPVGAIVSNAIAAKPSQAKGLAPLPAVSGGVATDQRLMVPTGRRIVKPEVKVVKATPKPVTKPVPTSKPAVAKPPVAAPVKAITAAPMLTIGHGTRLPNIGNYSILYSGKPVHFDVSPRVENGIPLTPFRHLFEHAGGKVGWVHAQKMVVANGLGKNIELKIGDSRAMVNKNWITMERAAFIESNRAVVPLSFMSNALNVKIDYDPAHKHVLITNK